ncbi:MAG: DHH family phosphoesterase, partial [Candidatus Diapherotrites archaeon]|nr:DHH family phosphoesterase [Candidatus Diapherotrites archaeon]
MQKPDTPQARDEKSFFLAIEKAAAKIKEQDDFVVVHHHDADGCASGAITIKALTREGKKVQSKCLKQLYREDIPKIKALGKSFLFVDFGSGQIDYLVEEFGEDFYILDHHQPAMASGEIPFCKYHLNPLLYGINGGTELSGAGVAFFFAHALNKKNADLSVLAVVGALGDMQDYNQYSTLEGLNKKLVEIAVNEKLLEVKKDLRLYGRISRPLVSFLMFSSNPILPQITANEENSKALLAGLGIPLKDSFTEQWLTYSDLNFEQKKSLTSALIVNMIENNQPEWKVRELVGDTYTLLKENPKSPLRDGKEFATLLNACG